MAEKRNTSRRSQSETQAPSRRNDVIRCAVCGEDYAVTYKRCPFCDERPGRSASGGKRTRNTRGGGYGHPVSTLQIVYLVITMILIIAALFIVFTKVAPLLFRGNDPGSSSSGTSQSSSVGDPGTSSSDPGGSASSSGETPDVPPAVTVEAISLSRQDFTLNPGETYQLLAAVSPAGVTDPVVWSSEDPSVAVVDQNGYVTNVNNTIEKRKTTIKASCGGREVTCIVYCKPGGTAGPGTTTDPGSTGTVAPNSIGTVVNAKSGLNIRSGPGSEYKKIASASNGAKVTILEDTGKGWYKVEVGNGVTGYVSADYISVSG